MGSALTGALASPEAEARRAAFACKQPNEGPVMLSVHVASHKKLLFQKGEDYRLYLERAQRQFFAAGVRVIGYFLSPRFVVWMTCELEPLAKERYKSELARKALKVLQEQYSRGFNARYFGEGAGVEGDEGAPWRGMVRDLKGFGMERQELRKLREQAEVSVEVRQHGENWMAHAAKVWLEPERVGEALRMVELLPQVFGLTERAEEYPYSSLRAHLGLVSEELVDLVRFAEWLPEGLAAEGSLGEAWRGYLELAQERARVEDPAKRGLWAYVPWSGGRPKEMTGRARHFGKAGVPLRLLEGGLVPENFCRVGWLKDLELWWVWMKAVGRNAVGIARRARGGFGAMGGELAAGGAPS